MHGNPTFIPHSVLTAYSGASCRRLSSSIGPSEARCWICRACSVALATRKPRYRDTCRIPSSAALNFASVCAKARVIALLPAISSVRPQPSREQADSIHMKCQPASRTPRSSCAGDTFSTDIHSVANSFIFRCRPSGNRHSVRRKIAGGLTTSRCRIFPHSPVHQRNPLPGNSAQLQEKSDDLD